MNILDKRQLFISAIIILKLLLNSDNAYAELFMNVSGRVIETTTGDILQNVKVTLMSKTKGKIAETDSDNKGKFNFPGIKQGIYDLLASSDDQFMIDSKVTVPVTVTKGKNIIGLTIKLQRGGAIKGKIITSTGFPVKQANIIGGGTSTSSDNDGYFFLRGVLPGKNQVGIFPTAVGSKLLPIISEVGKITDMGNIILAVGPETAIQGTVVDSNNRAISGAILVAYKNTASLGYAISNSKGAFFIAGLDVSQYSLLVVAYGHEEQTITNISVPVTGVSIIMTPSPIQTSSIHRYRLSRVKDEALKIVSKIIELVTPEDAFALQCQKGYCQDGTWVGVSVDFAGLGVFPGLLGPMSGTYAGTFSIGSYFCWNSDSNIQFTETCTYLGATTSDSQSIDLGFGLTPIISVWDACCAEDIEGPTSGVVVGLGTNVHGISKILKNIGVAGSIAYDYSPPTSSGTSVQYLSFSFGAGIPALDILIDWINGWQQSGGQLSPEGSDVFVAYRECNTEEAVNIFEWWLGTPGQ